MNTPTTEQDQTPETNNLEQALTTPDRETPELLTEGTEQPEPKPAREAAKYRRQLRETETERDDLRARIETMQRTEAERLASQHIAKGEALWASGTQLEDLLDERGNLDPLKVPAAANAAAEALGLNRPLRGPVIPGQGDTPNRPAVPTSWAQALGSQHDND